LPRSSTRPGAKEEADCIIYPLHDSADNDNSGIKLANAQPSGRFDLETYKGYVRDK
jgi:hypothetical protein